MWISKIYFRHVYSYFSSFKSWPLSLVFPSSFWGSFAGATWQNNTRPPFHVLCLAWLSQVAPAHINHSHSSSNSDQIAWPAPLMFRQNHLQCFHNNRITTWIHSSPPLNHTKERKISSSKNQQQREEQAFSKLFNLLTYKLHALGNYVLAILRHGTTDNFSTQVVCHNVYYWTFLLTIIKGRAWALMGETLLRAHKQNIQLQITNHKSRAPWTVFAKCKIAREAKAWDWGKHRGITSTQTFPTVHWSSYHQQRPTARYHTPQTLSDFRADMSIQVYSQVCVRQCRWPGFTCECNRLLSYPIIAARISKINNEPAWSWTRDLPVIS